MAAVLIGPQHQKTTTWLTTWNKYCVGENSVNSHASSNDSGGKILALIHRNCEEYKYFKIKSLKYF
jgi:hypothetical protein